MNNVITSIITTAILLVVFVIGVLFIMYNITNAYIHDHLFFLRSHGKTITPNNLHSGDIVLFVSQTNPMHLWIEFCQCSYVYHVGMIIRSHTSKLYMWDIQQRNNKTASLTPMDQLCNPNDTIIIRQLHPKIMDDELLYSVINEFSNVKYNIACLIEGAQRLISMLSDYKIGQPCSQGNQLYCSQLIAKTLVKLEYIDGDKLRTDVLPVDFTENNECIPFQNECMLGTEKILIFNGDR